MVLNYVTILGHKFPLKPNLWISEHCLILAKMMQGLQFWYGGIPVKKIQLDVRQVNFKLGTLYC